MRQTRLASALGAAGAMVLAPGCGDEPTRPERPADTVMAMAEAPAAAPSGDDRAALAAAISEAQRWLLPRPGGRDVPSDAIARRFADLASGLSEAEPDMAAVRIAAARQELDAFSHPLDAVAGEPRSEHWFEIAALGLVLDGVEAVLQGKVRLVPFDAGSSVSHAEIPRSANARKRPTSDRSLP
jgi:hypothetical protein